MNEISIWPTVSTGDIVLILTSLLLVALTFLFTRRRYQRKENEQGYWLAIYRFALKRQCDKKEMALLKAFIDTYAPAEVGDLLMSKKKFYNELFTFLRAHKEVEPEIEVRLLDKLFRRADDQLHVKSIRDLQVSEVVSLENSQGHFLAAIIDASKDSVLLSVDETQLNAGKADLYAYRPGTGGYLVEGDLQKKRSKAYIFTSNGRVTPKGDQHLMAEIEMQANLTPFHKDDGISEDKPVSIDVITAYISDRAMLFTYDESLDLETIWQVKVQLPDGFKLVCRGRLVKSSRSGYYICRFLDLSPALHQVLFSLIKENNPVRERFS